MDSNFFFYLASLLNKTAPITAAASVVPKVRGPIWKAFVPSTTKSTSVSSSAPTTPCEATTTKKSLACATTANPFLTTTTTVTTSSSDACNPFLVTSSSTATSTSTLFKEISGTDEIEVAACGVPVKNKASAAPLANEDELELEDSSICSSQSFNSKSTTTAQNNDIIEVKAVSEAPAATVVPESKVVIAEQQKPKEVFSLNQNTK